MNWISLICLLALSGAAFGRSGYGSFSGSSLFKAKPIVAERMFDVPLTPAPVSVDYGSSYGSGVVSRGFIFDQPKPATLPLSEADILCQGKTEGFVIVLLGGEKFVVCTADSKGDEITCPKGLLYNDETRRCERKYNPNQNPCASQPCLNGGRCIPTQYSFQCECGQGFTGRTCELDATVCQQQQPCGSAFDSVCQSFHVGSAMKHVCILQEGRAYGLTLSQAFPNPCLSSEGLHPLGFSNQGFIMCDGENMFIQSCPGGTIWDVLTKVCVWPEMEGTIGIGSISYENSNYGSSYTETAPRKLDLVKSVSYGAELPVVRDFPVRTSSYGAELPIVRDLPVARDFPVRTSSYGAELPIIRDLPVVRDLPVKTSSYGAELPIVRDFPVPTSSYGAQLPIARDLPIKTSSYGAQLPIIRDLPVVRDLPVKTNSYGAELPIVRDLPVPTSSYGAQLPIVRDLPVKTSSYGAQLPIARDLPVPTSSYGAQLPIVRDLPVPTSSYGAQLPIVRDLPVPSSSYGAQLPIARDLPVPTSSYGAKIAVTRDLPTPVRSQY